MKKILKKNIYLLLILSMVCSLFPNGMIVFSTDNEYLSFYDFNDYDAALGSQIYPDSNWGTISDTKNNWGSLRIEDNNSALCIGGGGEAYLSLGETIAKGKIHVSFDINCNGSNNLRTLMGFYNARDNIDPSSINKDYYSKAVMLNNAYSNDIVYYCSGSKTGSDMYGWTRVTSDVPLQLSGWHRIDLSFGEISSNDTAIAKFYIDGHLINEQDVYFSKDKGFKAFFIRVDQKAATTDYVTVDNLYIHNFSDNESLNINVTNNGSISTEDGKINLIFSEIINTDNFTEENISLKSMTGDNIPISIISADSKSAELLINGSIRQGRYILELSDKIKGGIYGNPIAESIKISTIINDKSFETFSGYDAKYNSGILPQGFFTAETSGNINIGTGWDNDISFNETLKAGLGAQPAYLFGRVIDDGKFHISFDIYTSDISKRQMEIGLYDARDNYDSYSVSNDYCSSAIRLNDAGISYYYNGTENDIISGQSVPTLYNIKNETWYRFDMIFDFSVNKADYYVNNTKITEQQIDISAAKGFKGLVFKVDYPDGIEESQKENYKLEDDVFMIDNLYTHSYSDLENLYSQPNENRVDCVNGQLNIVFSELVSSSILDKSKFTIKNISDNTEPPFRVISASARGVCFQFVQLEPETNYEIEISTGIRGRITGGISSDKITFKTEAVDNILINDDMETYTDDIISENWICDDKSALSLTTHDSGSAIKLNSSINSNSSISKAFSYSDDDIVAVEADIKYTGGFDIILSGDNGNEFGMGVNMSAAGYYTNSLSEMIFSNKSYNVQANIWHRIKLIADKKMQTLKMMIDGNVYDSVAFFDTQGINKVSFRCRKASGDSVFVDNVFLYTALNSGFIASTEFVNGTDTRGMKEFTEATIEKNGAKLNCCEGYVSEYNTIKYNVSWKESNIKYDIDDFNGNIADNRNTYIDIRYFDSGYGFFYLTYDSSKGEKRTETVCLFNSGKIESHTFKLPDASFSNGLDGGYDFIIQTMEGTDSRTYSSTPVYIQYVELYTDYTYSNIELNVNTGNVGNVFYDSDVPKFDITFDNTNDEKKSLTVKYTFSSFDKEMNKIPIKNETYEVEVGANTCELDNIYFDETKYGLYSLDIDISSTGEKPVKIQEEYPFSKCVGNTSLNNAIGANTTFISRYGNADELLQLMKNGGLGGLREGFEWSYYESTYGDKHLTDGMKKLLSACEKYKIEPLIQLVGNNNLYPDKNNTGLISDENMNNFADYVTSIVSEPEFKKNVSSVEIWNEPDNTKQLLNGEYIYNNNLVKGEQYAKMLKTGYNSVKNVNPDIKVAGFSITGIEGSNSKKFMDYALDALNGEKSFDVLSVHPYTTINPEFGNKGINRGSNETSLSYLYTYYKSLVKGTPLYRPYDNDYTYVTGIDTGNSYNFECDDELWHTEYGFSTGINENENLCIGDEFEQAVRLVRGCNTIRTENINDKIYLFGMADLGERKNEREHNFGMLHSYSGNVPYAAKYAYLAVSNFNKLTGSVKDISEVYNSNFSYINKYTCSDKDVYMMWTSKVSAPQNIAYDFETDKVDFYDLLGNQLDISEVCDESGYIITDVPYYAVVGDNAGQKTENNIYFTDGMRVYDDNTTIKKADILNGSIKVNIDNNIEKSGVLCGFFMNNILTECKQISKTEDNETLYKIDSIPENFDSMKLFLWNDISSIIPLCQSVGIKCTE